MRLSCCLGLLLNWKICTIPNKRPFWVKLYQPPFVYSYRFGYNPHDPKTIYQRCTIQADNSNRFPKSCQTPFSISYAANFFRLYGPAIAIILLIRDMLAFII
jgi:hypothetical protein